MVNEIRKIYPDGLNKGFILRFCIGSWVQHETPEKVWSRYQPKCYQYNNEDEDNCPNFLSDEKHIDIMFT